MQKISPFQDKKIELATICSQLRMRTNELSEKIGQLKMKATDTVVIY